MKETLVNLIPVYIHDGYMLVVELSLEWPVVLVNGCVKCLELPTDASWYRNNGLLCQVCVYIYIGEQFHSLFLNIL
jgi:hypothetical protein